jgi:hypothetical protein
MELRQSLQEQEQDQGDAYVAEPTLCVQNVQLVQDC